MIKFSQVFFIFLFKENIFILVFNDIKLWSLRLATVPILWRSGTGLELFIGWFRDGLKSSGSGLKSRFLPVQNCRFEII